MIPKKKLLSYYLGIIHMHEARDGARHLASSGGVGPELRHCIFTGIVVSYSRSFGSNDGLSSVDTKFRRFVDPSMQCLHDRLLDLRDTIYAHRDMVREKDFLDGAEDSKMLQSLRFEVSESGKSHWKVFRSVLKDEYLKDIECLCEYQKKRFQDEADKAIRHFTKGKSYSPGLYDFGEGFP